MWRPGILIADVAGCTDKSSEMRIRISARRNCENARVMGKRIRNYRTGDRAEDLGIFLFKAFCAIAPIPRQEDFGLADAVATLLRSEGKVLVRRGLLSGPTQVPDREEYNAGGASL